MTLLECIVEVWPLGTAVIFNAILPTNRVEDRLGTQFLYRLRWQHPKILRDS